MSSLETNLNRNVRTSLDLYCRTNCSKAFVWSKQLTLLLIILSRRTIKRCPLRCIRNVFFVASIKFLYQNSESTQKCIIKGVPQTVKLFIKKDSKHDKRDIKPNADGRNIFSQKLPTLFKLHVASVFPVVACCCVLLGVVGQMLKPVKLLRQQLPTFLLFVRVHFCSVCFIVMRFPS